MRILHSLVILVVVASVAHAQELQGDLAKLQGTWTTRIGPKKDLPITWTVKRDKVVATIKTMDGKTVTTKFTLKLDENAAPKAFDQTKMQVDFGGDVGELDYEDSPAIYELKGDEWKVCLVPVGSPRPNAFIAGESSDVLTFTRVKDTKAKR